MSKDSDTAIKSQRLNFFLDFGGSQYDNSRKAKVLMAIAQCFGNQLAAMRAVTTMGKYAHITLTPNWPPGSSLLVI